MSKGEQLLEPVDTTVTDRTHTAHAISLLSSGGGRNYVGPNHILGKSAAVSRGLLGVLARLFPVP